MSPASTVVDPKQGKQPLPKAPPPASETVRCVTRAMELLDTLTDFGGEASLGDLASVSRLPPSSVHRLLQTCISHGYVRQTHTHRYALGPRLVTLGDVAGRQLGHAAQPRLRDLVTQLGESASLAVKDGDQVLYVAEQPSHQAMRMCTEIGRRASLHSTSVGKVILSALSDADIQVIIRRTGMNAHTPKTLRTISALLADVARIRSLGYAIDEEEHDLAVRSYAVAIPHAPTPMALSVSAPIDRVTDALTDQVVQRLHHTAAEISNDLRQ